MSKYLGDFAAGDTIDFKFTTFRPSTGAAYTLGGTPAISVYKDNGTTESTSGVTLTADFDSRTGLNHVRITTSSDGTFYADGSQFEAVITTGTVDSVSVVGSCVGRFTLRAQAALYPTTAGRKLDVSTTGEAGIDFANIGSPTTTVNLSGTTIKAVTDMVTANAIQISGDATAADNLESAADGTGYNLGAGQIVAASVTGAVGSVTGNVGGNVAGSVNSVTGAVGSVTGNVGGNVVGNVNGNVVGSVNSVTTGVTVATNNDKTGYSLATAPPTAAAIADAVWDEAVSGHVTADTFGERVLLSDGNNGNTVKVTPPGHIAADVHEFQAGVIEDADFAVGSVNDRLDTMLVADGAVYQYTANALELAPSGGGGGGGSTTVRMGPFIIKAEGQASDVPLDINKGATHGIDCFLVDAQGTGVDLAGATYQAKVYNTSGTLVATVNGSATYAAGGGMTWTIPTSVTNTAGTYTATITRTTGPTDTQVFGPLRIYVRDI